MYCVCQSATDAITGPGDLLSRPPKDNGTLAADIAMFEWKQNSDPGSCGNILNVRQTYPCQTRVTNNDKVVVQQTEDRFIQSLSEACVKVRQKVPQSPTLTCHVHESYYSGQLTYV